eukprot:TRINITY_DN1795_c0_g1_i1.p2 TRINITY_DN1795_c0_g1~~TRINITY_DN1795_c0_g1_i1.p2  ORF type:complete len:238 (+),score=70.52 TRINITY_DN1795_c0_g1_i1:1825-2538(+)
MHGYGYSKYSFWFYPGGGPVSCTLRRNVGNTSEKDEIYPGGILNIPMEISATRPQWRNALRSKAFPRINEFRPDMIFVSAGFDAHEEDEVGDGMGRLIEFDYTWITKELQKLANRHCEGRIVSVLEGGYNLRGGLLSPLAQSVNCHTTQLRSRSREYYKEPTPEELEQLAKIDEKMEERRQKCKEAEEQKHSMKDKGLLLSESEKVLIVGNSKYDGSNHSSKGDDTKSSEHERSKVV